MCLHLGVGTLTGAAFQSQGDLFDKGTPLMSEGGPPWSGPSVVHFCQCQPKLVPKVFHEVAGGMNE